jgi:hypothetical protein
MLTSFTILILSFQELVIEKMGSKKGIGGERERRKGRKKEGSGDTKLTHKKGGWGRSMMESDAAGTLRRKCCIFYFE